LAALGWIINLGFAGGTAQAAPPERGPGAVQLGKAVADNNLVLSPTGNSVLPVKSANELALPG
jgi:hypothetical protein